MLNNNMYFITDFKDGIYQEKRIGNQYYVKNPRTGETAWRTHGIIDTNQQVKFLVSLKHCKI